MPTSPPFVRETPMAKKKPKVNIYADVDERLKRRLERVREREGRKLNKQLEIALTDWLDRYEEEHDLPDIDQAGEG